MSETSVKPTNEPERGSRWLDRDTGKVVVYIGDCGYGAQWQSADDPRDGFYCDWHDFFVWNRFQSATGAPT